MSKKPAFNNGDIEVVQTVAMETVQDSFCSMQDHTTEQHYKILKNINIAAIIKMKNKLMKCTKCGTNNN